MCTCHTMTHAPWQFHCLLWQRSLNSGTACSPPLIYLVVKKPSMRSGHFWASWIILIACMLITILGAIGAMRGIITDASSYAFYQ